MSIGLVSVSLGFIISTDAVAAQEESVSEVAPVIEYTSQTVEVPPSQPTYEMVEAVESDIVEPAPSEEPVVTVDTTEEVEEPVVDATTDNSTESLDAPSITEESTVTEIVETPESTNEITSDETSADSSEQSTDSEISSINTVDSQEMSGDSNQTVNTVEDESSDIPFDTEELSAIPALVPRASNRSISQDASDIALAAVAAVDSNNTVEVDGIPVAMGDGNSTLTTTGEGVVYGTGGIPANYTVTATPNRNTNMVDFELEYKIDPAAANRLSSSTLHDPRFGIELGEGFAPPATGIRTTASVPGNTLIKERAFDIKLGGANGYSGYSTGSGLSLSNVDVGQGRSVVYKFQFQ